MIPEDILLIEKQFTDIKAEEYRGKGYEVLRDAELEMLPGVIPDLIVRKGDEVRVIEVKTRSSLSVTSAVSEMARVVNAKPGWSFDLLLVGEPERLDTPPGAQPFGMTDIRRRLAEAEKALTAGFAEAAFLLTWSAGDAIIRTLVAAEGVAIKRTTTPAYLLDMAVVHGAITREDYDHLTNMLRYRNAIAHGFAVNDFDDAMAPELIAAVRMLLADKVAA